MAYSAEEREKILNETFNYIEDGLSLRKALSKVNLSSNLFYRWIDQDEIKLKQYARACEERAEALLDEMIDIVDDSANDQMIVNLGDGIEATRLNSEAIQRSRLRYDARRWLISKLNPKKYGDKIDHTSGGEKLPPINFNIIVDDTEDQII